MIQTIPLQVNFKLTDEQLSAIADKVASKLSAHLDKDKERKAFSVKELAEKYPVCEQTIRNWIKDGKVRAEQLGRRIFVDEAEFQKAMSEVKSLNYKR